MCNCMCSHRQIFLDELDSLKSCLKLMMFLATQRRGRSMTSMEKMPLRREWEAAAAVISIAHLTFLSNFFRVLAALVVIKISIYIIASCFPFRVKYCNVYILVYV